MAVRPSFQYRKAVARAPHQRLHERIDLDGAVGDQRERQERIGTHKAAGCRMLTASHCG